MELKSLFTVEAHEKGNEIRIKSPVDGKPTHFYITVAGPDSKTYRAAVRDYHREIMKDNAEVGAIEMLVSVTKDWRGLKDGKNNVAFSVDEARNIYTGSPFVANQVDGFIADRANFTPG